MEEEELSRQAIIQRYDRGLRGDQSDVDDWENPNFKLYACQDRYGFIHNPSDSRRVGRNLSESPMVDGSSLSKDLERRRSLKWADMLKSQSTFFPANARHRSKLVDRVYKGIPDGVRCQAWYIFLQIDEIKHRQIGVYHAMLAKAKAVAASHCAVSKNSSRISSPSRSDRASSADDRLQMDSLIASESISVNSSCHNSRHSSRGFTCYVRQIDLDVNRTYRNHVMFRHRYSVRQVALFNVLLAYSVYNTDIGYCQGMSQIAALFIMYLGEEEDVFWALHQLMTLRRYAMHGFFIQGFPKLHRFQSIFDGLLKKRLPKLYKHLTANEIDSSIYTIKWFFQCFLDRLPFSLCLRTWDVFLLEGESVLLAQAYNIMRLHRRHMLGLSMDHLIVFLQSKLEYSFGFSDDHVIEKLREAIADLSSLGLIPLLGNAATVTPLPSNELPVHPFGVSSKTVANGARSSIGRAELSLISERSQSRAVDVAKSQLLETSFLSDSSD